MFYIINFFLLLKIVFSLTIYPDYGFSLPLLLPVLPTVSSHPDLPHFDLSHLRDNNKIKYNQVKQKKHTRIGQNKQTGGKEPKKRHKKQIETQRLTHFYTKESHKSTKPEAIIYT